MGVSPPTPPLALCPSEKAKTRSPLALCLLEKTKTLVSSPPFPFRRGVGFVFPAWPVKWGRGLQWCLGCEKKAGLRLCGVLLRCVWSACVGRGVCLSSCSRAVGFA